MNEKDFKKFLIEELTKFKDEPKIEKRKEILKKIDQVLFHEFVIPVKKGKMFNNKVLEEWQGTLVNLHDYGIERIISEQEIFDMLEDLKQNKVNFNNIGKYWKLIE